jgi:hypothetical protein
MRNTADDAMDRMYGLRLIPLFADRGRKQVLEDGEGQLLHFTGLTHTGRFGFLICLNCLLKPLL